MKNNDILLRSMLYVPTYKEKFIDHALDTDADALILDLEDAVPDKDKATARKVIKKYIDEGKFANRTIFIRLNPIESKLLFEDLKYVMHSDIYGFILTKIYTYEDMIYYDKLITQLEVENGIEQGHFKLIPLIETTSGVLDVYNISRSSDRIVSINFGAEDFLNDLEGIHGEPPRALDYPRAAIALAARSAGVYPIDTPYLRVKDYDGFMKEETISREMGYAGCQLIHPSQIEFAHKCFTPSREEMDKSVRIVQAVEDAKKMGSGVAMLDGAMIGPPMQKRAEKVIRIMELISKIKGEKFDI